MSATRLIVRLIARLQSTASSSWPEHIHDFLQQLATSAPDNRRALLAIVAGAAKELGVVTKAERPGTRTETGGQPPTAEALPLAELLRYAESELLDLSSAKGRIVPSVRVRRMVSLIEERYAHRLTVGELARAVSRDRGHVSSVFRREMGDTVHRYLTRVRMRHAADLVGRGEKIEAVMLMVGYHSKKSFYHHFRSHFGVTPGAFRQCCTAQPDDQ